MAEPLTLFLSTIGAAAGKAGVTEGARVLRELVGLQDAQVRLLRSIDTKVDQLVEGPFYTGRRQLEDALSVWRDSDDRVGLLRLARSSFTAALGQDRDPLRRSLAALHLAAVWLALDSPRDVGRALEEAHLEALRALDAEGRRGGRNLTQLFAEERVIDQRRRERQGRISPYANGLARTRREWGTPAIDAPIFIGYVIEDNEEENLQLAVAMAIRFRQMQEQAAQLGLSDGPPPMSFPETLADRPALRDRMEAEVLRGEVRLEWELADWLETRGASSVV